MKTILTLLLLAISAPMMAQTNIISLKSHAGDIAAIDKETDNFGEPPWKMNVDTVEFIQKGVIVEYGFLGHRDTLRSDFYDEHITDRLKDYYSPRCVFIGFKESKHKNYQQEKQSKKNGIGIVAALVVIALMLNFRKTKPLNSIFTSLLIVGAITFHSSSLSAQTNVISLKSHAGDIAQIHFETDNFGGPAIIRHVDTVFFLKKGCIIEVSSINSYHQGKNYCYGNQAFYDTIYADYYDGLLTDRLKGNYSSECIFIGFKESKHKNYQPEQHTKKNRIALIAVLISIALILNGKKLVLKSSSFNSFLIFGAITFLSSSLSAQTNVISLKSHAGDIAQIQRETDNFGNPPMSLYPELSQSETVTYFDEGKIIHYQLNRIGMPIYDTIFDPNITQELTPYLRNKFPSSTQFIGFKRPNLDAAKPYFDTIHKNGFSYWLFIFLGITMFSFTVKKRFS